MYDADEQLHDITQVGRTTVNTVKTGIQIVQQLRNLTAHQIAELAINDSSFLFTGQSTDLRFFLKHNVMSMDMVRNIPDAELRYAVQDELNHAAQAGYIQINPQQNCIALTESGKRHINSPSFQEAARRHVSAASQELQLQTTQTVTENMGFPLNGSMNDIQVFRYTDTVDLSEILQSPNSEVAQKVLSGLQKLEQEGKVAIDGLKVSLTEAGKQTLASPMMEAAAGSVKLVPTGEPVSTAIVTAVSAVKTAVQKAGDVLSHVTPKR